MMTIPSAVLLMQLIFCCCCCCSIAAIRAQQQQSEEVELLRELKNCVEGTFLCGNATPAGVAVDVYAKRHEFYDGTKGTHIYHAVTDADGKLPCSKKIWQYKRYDILYLYVDACNTSCERSFTRIVAKFGGADPSKDVTLEVGGVQMYESGGDHADECAPQKPVWLLEKPTASVHQANKAEEKPFKATVSCVSGTFLCGNATAPGVFVDVYAKNASHKFSDGSKGTLIYRAMTDYEGKLRCNAHIWHYQRSDLLYFHADACHTNCPRRFTRNITELRSNAPEIVHFEVGDVELYNKKSNECAL